MADTVDVSAQRAMRPRVRSSAKSLLLTILGEFALPRGGSAWTSTLLRALGACAVSEGSARQAIARLADDGVLRSTKAGRRARWYLTEGGQQLLVDGTKRIYGFGAHEEAWDGRWLAVICSVPEEQRAKRHQLRSRLAFCGFGFLAPGVAVAPDVGREGVANSILKDLDLASYAIVLRTRTGEITADGEVLDRAWDLDNLAERYRDFIRAFEGRKPGRDAARFSALVELVHSWRRFPFIDPEIPTQLLPPNWIGDEAKTLFDTLHARWSGAAKRWFEAVEGGD